MKVEITERARQKLFEISAYLKDTAPEYRDLVLTRLRQRIFSLANFPLRGSPMKAFGNPNVRELYEMSYRISYLVKENTVFVLNVEHMKQRRARLKKH